MVTTKEIKLSPDKLLQLSEKITKGLSNHERMMLKKIGRGGQETRSRTERNRNRKEN